MDIEKHQIVGYWNRFDRDVSPIAGSIVILKDTEHYIANSKGIRLIDEFDRWDEEGWVARVTPIFVTDISGRILVHENLEEIKSGITEPEMCTTYLLPEEEYRFRRKLRDAYLWVVTEKIVLAGKDCEINWNEFRLLIDHAHRAVPNDFAIHLLKLATAENMSWFRTSFSELEFELGRNKK